LDEAIACYRRALRLKWDPIDANTSFGNLFRERGRLEEGLATFRREVELKPDDPGAHLNLGLALKELGRLEEALACNLRAVELEPNYAAAHNNMGSVLSAQGRFDDAVACIRKAIELNPKNSGAYNNLGAALAALGQVDEAFACYRKAVELEPVMPRELRERQPDRASASARSVFALNPGRAIARTNLGMAMLAGGEFAAGWQEYEWRWKTPQMLQDQRLFAGPRWNGEPAEGKTLLILAEQGFGDTLQFCRYGPLAAERGLRVVMEVQKPLVRLLQSLPGVERVLARGEERREFDLHCPMLSMPLAMETTLETIPASPGYLRADDALIANWRERLAAMGINGPRVGLAWAGSGTLNADRRRSLPPARFAPLVDVPGVHFFSLQKDGPPPPPDFHLIDFMDEMEDFADTAALIANLDLVIAVDTAVVHLGGALGKPVWMLDRFDPDWRWLRGRRDSPWYPTLRIYRQRRPGDWGPVLAEAAMDLRNQIVGVQL
jgi:Flp pilus assembly protein TadD